MFDIIVMDMGLRTWNVRKFVVTVTSNSIKRYIFYGKGNENHDLGTGFFFLCLRKSYQQLSLLVIGCCT
jgi:hypothetical protein